MTAKNRRVVDLSEVAAALGVSRTTAWRWCSPGRIPKLKVLPPSAPTVARQNEV